jgi:hypothetical protein
MDGLHLGVWGMMLKGHFQGDEICIERNYDSNFGRNIV